jgi:hypothetical protein
VIGQEHQEAVVLGVVEFDAPHFAGIISAGGGRRPDARFGRKPRWR